jgi:6-phosphofructokinase 1
MAVLRGDKIIHEDLAVAVGKTRTVDMELYEGVARHFFA